MDAEKPFEVGEWVWYWGAQSRMGWVKIVKVDDDIVCFVNNDGRDVWNNAEKFTRNPVIPPKPKTKRTVDRHVYVVKEIRGCFELCEAIPRGATNIRILYDIEE